jgi:hypothetical protein
MWGLGGASVKLDGPSPQEIPSAQAADEDRHSLGTVLETIQHEHEHKKETEPTHGHHVGFGHVRKSRSERPTSVHITEEITESALFDTVNESHTGAITKEEFHKLYGHLHNEARADIQKEHELERKASQTGRRLKLVSCFAMTLFAFLSASVAANFAVVFYVVDAQVKTSTSGDTLVDKESGAALKTASAHSTLALDSRLPDEVWDELEYIHITNDNGGMLHAHIQAVSRVPWMHEDVGCEEPLFDTYAPYTPPAPPAPK